MFLRPHRRHKDGKDHTYWSLVETVRTASGPRHRQLCYLGELNDSARARWAGKAQPAAERRASLETSRVNAVGLVLWGAFRVAIFRPAFLTINQ